MKRELFLFLRHHCCSASPPPKNSPNSCMSLAVSHSLTFSSWGPPPHNINLSLWWSNSYAGGQGKNQLRRSQIKHVTGAQLDPSFAERLSTSTVCLIGKQDARMPDRLPPVPWSQKPTCGYSAQLPADLYGLQPRVLEQLICSSCSYIFYLPCYLIDPGCAWPWKEALLDLQHMLYILYVLLCPDKEQKSEMAGDERRGSPAEQDGCKSLAVSCVFNLSPLPLTNWLSPADSSSLKTSYLFRF